jgi:hypothetical protein
MTYSAESFPDIHHLVYLRNRLWARKPLGRAAVMVGAGFSLNAESRLGKSASFPLWGEITGLMLDKLRPTLTPKQRRKALEKAVAGSGSLTLALEFEATFGRSALDDLIISAVPDNDHSPGFLHEVLLSLPWADVFTTNYDTLLERTRSTGQGRYYDVVVQPSDLPNSTQPRIFKLHGSLPSTKPFIITEEDFRRYPRAFAPFVNTVQQSMMENDFVLLGFSGSDPNFLSWSGWVRDELTTLRARVYLCGVLDLDNAQRLVLRERGVTAIDLGSLFPEANYKDNRSQRNQDALLWFLKSLQNGRTVELPVRWPSFKLAPDIGRHSPPIEPLGEISPKAAPKEKEYLKTRPSYNQKEQKLEYAAESLKEIARQIAAWSQTRQSYPGWIVLPHRNRNTLVSQTTSWRNHIIEWSASLPAEDRLLPLYELTWRLELCMLVTDSTKEEDLIKQTLEEIPIPDSPIQQEQWATIAFYRLKQLRHDFNTQDFHHLLNKLEPLAKKQPRYAAWRCWHAAIERLEHLDQTAARKWLQQWPDVHNDPVWDLRRAGLWAEIGELETAERYAMAALDTALQQQPKSNIRIDMLSVEESTRHLLTDVRRAKWFQGDKSDPKENLWDVTEDELARDQLYNQYRCNTSAETERLEALLKAPEPEIQLSIYETVNPYTGTRSRTRTTGGGIDLKNYQPAFDMLDIHERRGHPADLPNIAFKGLGLAARWVSNIHSSRALGIVVRSCNDNLLKQLLDKSSLVQVEAKELHPLLDKALELIEQNFPAAGTGHKPLFTDRNKTQYVGLALRIVGRAAFRLNEEQRTKAVQVALGVWDNWPRELLEKRSFYIERDHYSDFAEGITSIMLPEEVTEHLSMFVAVTPEPQFAAGVLDSIPAALLPKNRPNMSAFSKAVKVCLDWLISEKQSIQQIALRRLFTLQELGWLTKKELNDFGKRVWEGLTNTDELPDFERAPALWTVLLIPAPASVDVVNRLKHHLLTSAESYLQLASKGPNSWPHGTRGFDQLLFNINHATLPTSTKLSVGKSVQRLWVEWTKKEALTLFETLESMLTSQEHFLVSTQQAKKGEDFGGGIGLDAEDEFFYAGQFLRDVVLPHLTVEDEAYISRIYTCVKKLIHYDLPARSALPGLLAVLPGNTDIFNFTVTSIRLALVNPTSAVLVQDGVEAVCRWAYGAQRGVFPSLPDDLFYEFTIRLGMPGLPNLLAVVRWSADLMTAAPHIFWPSYAQQLADALQLLTKETEAPSWVERNMARSITTKERLYQRPRIREEAARLAGQLSWLNTVEPVLAIEEVLSKWQQLASADVRHEVRRAWQMGNTDEAMIRNW